MKCPYCGKDNTRVIDSRPADDGDSIRRRRECDECHKRFTTYEKVETIPMIVIKKDNNRETYDRAKIEGGVFRACHKRPISAAQIEAMIDDVEACIFNKEERETLEDFLDTKVFAGNQGSTLNPDPEGVEGFNMFMERYMKGLSIEQAAVDSKIW